MDAERKTQEIQKVMGTPKYNAYDRTTRIAELSKAMVYYAQRRGTQMKSEETVTFAGMLDDDVYFYYGDRIAFAEVKLALDWGTRGEYGDNTGINPDRLFRHIRSYMESEERTEAIRRTNNRLALPVPTEGKDLYHRFVRYWDNTYDTVVNEWHDYKNGNFKPCTPAAKDIFRKHDLSNCYCWLRSVGLVADEPQTDKAEMAAFKQAVKVTDNDYSASIYAGALLLERYFEAAKKSDFDLNAQLDALQGTSEDDKFKMKWYELKYIKPQRNDKRAV